MHQQETTISPCTLLFWSAKAMERGLPIQPWDTCLDCSPVQSWILLRLQRGLRPGNPARSWASCQSVECCPFPFCGQAGTVTTAVAASLDCGVCAPSSWTSAGAVYWCPGLSPLPPAFLCLWYPHFKTAVLILWALTIALLCCPYGMGVVQECHSSSLLG